jgi:HEAT repeat protein
MRPSADQMVRSLSEEIHPAQWTSYRLTEFATRSKDRIMTFYQSKYARIYSARAVGVCLMAAAVVVSCKAPEPSTEELLGQLNAKDVATRNDAAEQLVRRDHPKGLAYFQQLFAEGNTDTKTYAARLLGEKPHPKSLPMLLGALVPDSPVAAESLAYHLQSPGNPTEDVPILLQKIGEKSSADTEMLNEVILFSLGEFRQKETLPYLVALLSSGSLNVRRAARIALTKIGSPALPILEREYHRAGNHSQHGPTALMETVGEFKDPSAIPLLMEGIADGDLWTRNAAGDGLIKLGDKAKAEVKDALHSDSEITRAQAEELLKRWGKEPEKLL